MDIQRILIYKSTFGLFALHQHGMHDLKIDTKTFLQKSDGNQKLHVKHIMFYMHGLDEIIHW